MSKKKRNKCVKVYVTIKGHGSFITEKGGIKRPITRYKGFIGLINFRNYNYCKQMNIVPSYNVKDKLESYGVIKRYVGVGAPMNSFEEAVINTAKILKELLKDHLYELIFDPVVTKDKELFKRIFCVKSFSDD